MQRVLRLVEIAIPSDLPQFVQDMQGLPAEAKKCSYRIEICDEGLPGASRVLGIYESQYTAFVRFSEIQKAIKNESYTENTIAELSFESILNGSREQPLVLGRKLQSADIEVLFRMINKPVSDYLMALLNELGKGYSGQTEKGV